MRTKITLPLVPIALGNISGVDHTVAQPSLLDQLETKGLTWKGYFEDIPSPGYKGTTYPNLSKALYASKHNGFINFKKVQDNPQELAKLVGFDQLTADLQSGHVPNYSHIIPNQCNEMHGLSVICPIPTIVITNHGGHGVKDNTAYNHYSLLRTVEEAFGIRNYLNYAGDTAGGVKPMTPLFAPTAATRVKPS